MSGAVRCVLKRWSLSVPLNVSIDKNAKEQKLFLEVSYVLCSWLKPKSAGWAWRWKGLALLSWLVAPTRKVTWFSLPKGGGQELETLLAIGLWELSCSLFWPGIQVKNRGSLSGLAGTKEKKLVGRRWDSILEKGAKVSSWVWISSREQ